MWERMQKIMLLGVEYKVHPLLLEAWMHTQKHMDQKVPKKIIVTMLENSIYHNTDRFFSSNCKGHTSHYCSFPYVMKREKNISCPRSCNSIVKCSVWIGSLATAHSDSQAFISEKCLVVSVSCSYNTRELWTQSTLGRNIQVWAYPPEGRPCSLVVAEMMKQWPVS